MVWEVMSGGCHSRITIANLARHVPAACALLRRMGPKILYCLKNFIYRYKLFNAVLGFFNYFLQSLSQPAPYYIIYFQVNFLICQISALFLASLFRSMLHPSKVSSKLRHTFALSIGLAFGYFCFGQQAIHIAGLPAICYIVIRTQDPRIVQR